jgi:hypothetical protein
MEFFPHHSKMPQTSSADYASLAARDLIHALLHPAPAAPFAQLGSAQSEALQQLAQIFASSARLLPNNKPVAKPVQTPVQTPRLAAKAPRVPTIASPATPANAPRVPNPTARYPTRSRHPPQNFANLLASPVSINLPAITDHLPKHFAYAVVDPDTGESMEYRQLSQNTKTQTKWKTSFANELGRLAQGVGNRFPGTNTILFIPHHKVPKDRKVTYGRIVVSIRPQKTEVERTPLTVGGNLIDYPGKVSTETADLTTAKILFNSVLSDRNSKFMGMDLKNFYLNTPLDRYEYMRLPIDIIPDEILEQYNLLPMAHKGYIYIEIQKGMYGLPQAGILANKLLKKRLAVHNYFPCVHTPGLWKHKTRPVIFSLVVDDFGVKYTGREHAEHLYNALEEHYEAACDWDGKLYCGVTLAWDYKARTVDLSMPGYVTAALHQFQHPTPRQPCYAPSKWNVPN